jgi:anti-sigma B factor antagonist
MGNDVAVLAARATAHRPDNTDQRARPDRTAPLCDAPHIVRNVNTNFPTDILGLQVAEHGPDARVVTVVGEIDTLTAPELATFLTAQLTVAQLVVVHLDGVRFLGSAGLSVLFEANELAAREDRDLRLVCNSRTANLALEATGLREHFTFADTVPDALKNSP